MTAKEFDKEYRRLLLPLGMYALRIIGSVGDSEDVVQTVFLKTWDRIRAGFEPDNLKAYLYMAVRNASLRHLSAKADELTDDIEDAAEVTEEDVDTWATPTSWASPLPPFWGKMRLPRARCP